MTKELIFTLRHYLKYQYFKIFSLDKPASLAMDCLHEKMSYRLPGSANQDLLIGFRVLKRTMSRLYTKVKSQEKDYSPDCLIISGTQTLSSHATTYVTRSAHVKNPLCLAKDSIAIGPVSVFFIMLFFIFGLLKAFECLFRKKRSNHALVISSIAEITFILYTVKHKNIAQVYDFVPYENDSNLMYLLLKGISVNVCKIPSSNPLVTHHSKLLTDQLVLSNPYQQSEIDSLNLEIHFTQILNWPPEKAYQFFPAYKEKKPDFKQNTIGFYSHGEWLRQAKKDADYGAGIGKEELKILEFLKLFQLDHKEYKIVIFPHPKELSAAHIDSARDFYNSNLEGCDFEIFHHREGTSKHFHDVNIAVCAFSAVVFERLYCGYKILISRNAMNSFPISGHPLNNICFDNYSQFSSLLLKHLPQSNEEFFEQTQLTDFLHYKFEEP